MSRTFLELCRDVVNDLGVAGGKLSTVENNTSQELVRVINWVARADLFVQALWSDWNFLWTMDDTAKIAAGTPRISITLPTTALAISRVDYQSVFIGAGTDDAQRLQWMDWNDFRPLYVQRPVSPGDDPSVFSRSPEGTLYVNERATADIPVSLCYWTVSKRMTMNGDTSPIPQTFDNIICERAKIMYAEREDAPEIMSGSTAEYNDILDKMQAFYLPENLGARTSKNDPTTLHDGYVE